jgi:hypothetical protein
MKVNMESYIVRIYRGETDNPHNLVGTVEQAETEKNPLPILRAMEYIQSSKKAAKEV